MLLAYVSGGTKNTERLVGLLGHDSLDLDTIDTIGMEPIDRPFLLVVPSYEDNPFYDILADVLDADEGVGNCKGIIGTGNKNFNDLYLVTAKELSREYDLPIVADVEFFGTESDRERVNDVIDFLD